MTGSYLTSFLMKDGNICSTWKQTVLFFKSGKPMIVFRDYTLLYHFTCGFYLNIQLN